jgi:hypothetical protein
MVMMGWRGGSSSSELFLMLRGVEVVRIRPGSATEATQCAELIGWCVGQSEEPLLDGIHGRQEDALK